MTSPMTGKPVQNVKSVPTNASMSTPPAPVDWPILLTWLRRLEEARRLKDVASFIANDGRLLFGADRVSIAVPHGRRAKIVAVSGQDKVHHRSNLTKSMARLAKLVMATKEPFQFNGGVENLPPPLEQPLAEFTQLGGARYVLIIPLLTPKSFDSAAKPADGSEEKPSDRIVQGALIVEQMQQSQPTGELTAYLDLVRDHIGAAIHHARSTESIFLLPVWIWIGHWWSALRGRRLAWTMIALVATIIVSIAMVIIPWDYRVDANGALMPVTQRDVFAPWDGQVVELHVNGGDKVEAGQELLRLRNDELEAERVKSESELNEKLKSVVALQAELDNADKKGDQNEVTRIQ
ncbi:MAG: biotin/lipoyl-binding protein, partial [Planctomycetes bacterium]|nr:biotin/lipoyl-binding protein [Planctomycetota bacterium]